jgi:leucyl/phenylalanyl-tRNA--protein transferase
MTRFPKPVPWLLAGEKFPAPHDAWGAAEAAPGLLAAGGSLDVNSLVQAYSAGIFPWFSLGQPIFWWSPNPRMVLQTQDFKLHRSLKKTLQRFRDSPRCSLTFDSAFEQVITACAGAPRDGQAGTWIVPEMIAAYSKLHQAGHAHSVETWVNGELVGGLYCVNLGGMVFGESMFAQQTDASKIALSALVAFCKAKDISMIDCQQNTQHLSSLGAREISRETFNAHVKQQTSQTTPKWVFEAHHWDEILPPHRQPTALTHCCT